MSSDLQKEFLDVVDEDDLIIDIKPKDVVYQNKLTHRIVHILIFNEEAKLLLQLRSKENKYLPHFWGTSVGGHVASGETYEQAAMREYQEELNASSEIEVLVKDLYLSPDQKIKKFMVTFTTVNSGPFKITEKDKIEKVEFFSMKEIKQMIDKGENFHPELLFLLTNYFGIENF